jgi:hypothetical protein
MGRVESSYEKTGTDYAKAAGWTVYKVMFGTRGAPDRLFAKKPYGPVFVEWKKPDEEPTPQQEHRHDEMRKAGIVVLVFDDADKFKGWIDAHP